MKPLFDEWDFVLFCSREDCLALPSIFVAGREHRFVGQIAAWRLISVSDVGAVAQLANASSRLDRYLDRFYLWHTLADPTGGRKLVEGVFELLACDYENLIEAARNIQNIRNLVLILQAHFGSLYGRLLVDFGCGTGLAATVAKQWRLNVIGVDQSATMRMLASAKGMTVLAPEDLQKAAITPSAAFASYVLHLEVNLSDLEALWTLLPADGIFVANFHKNRGLQRMDVFMSTLGAKIITVERHPDDVNGTYRQYARRR